MPPITGHQVLKVEVNLPVITIGIDPGASGGIAWVDTKILEGGWISIEGNHATPMPKTEGDVWDAIQRLKLVSSRTFAVVEQLTGFVGEAVPSHTMFKLGRSYGFLIGCLTAAGVPYELVTPQKWQKELGIPRRDKKESKTQWKNRLKARAQQIFPDIKVTLATADALLIAEYARRVWLARERPNTSHTGA